MNAGVVRGGGSELVPKARRQREYRRRFSAGSPVVTLGRCAIERASFIEVKLVTSSKFSYGLFKQQIG